MSEERCERCGWPLVQDPKDGCTKGNCSMRGLGPQEFIPHDDDPEPPARCKSCGVPFVAHLGLQGTCAALQRARALLERWQASVTVCEHAFGPASHLGKIMIDQLQAAIDGDHIPDAGKKVG